MKKKNIFFASFNFKSMKKEAGSAPKCPGSPTPVFLLSKLVDK
jgi:hypothetical protein